ncbi:MAG: hypothetical protein KGI78_02270 [Patescibacteria group bacterium]|nr:hypothetical protein [Patescibacteria group bacterium]MDE1944525.1 hypothetical protein [Patescibacteria group bacterium]MDE1945364.1 hypothetical protein [Patescibacteria group bacterium]MDE2057659.1 hypothetical protein [Patescibacteria group bacterium]
MTALLLLQQLAYFGALLLASPILYRLMRGYPITRTKEEEALFISRLPHEEVEKIRQLAWCAFFGWLIIIASAFGMMIDSAIG